MNPQFEIFLTALCCMIFTLLSIFLGVFIDKMFALFVFGCPFILIVYGIKNDRDF